MSQEFEKKSIVPSGPSSFDAQGCLFRVRSQDIEGDVADHGKISGGVVFAAATLVFLKDDVERPM